MTTHTHIKAPPQIAGRAWGWDGDLVTTLCLITAANLVTPIYAKLWSPTARVYGGFPLRRNQHQTTAFTTLPFVGLLLGAQ